MMKTKYTLLPLAPLLMAIIFTFLFTACGGSENDHLLPEQSDKTGSKSSMLITAKKLPFDDDSGTRISTDLNGNTSFGNNDEVGVIALKSSAVETDCNNVKIIYNSTTGKWEGKVPYIEDASYIAYYPYRAVMDGKKNAEEIYNAFVVAPDQSNATKFTANDLMIDDACTVNTTNKTLSMTFQHKLALLEFRRVLHARTSDNWLYPLKNVTPQYEQLQINGSVKNLYKDNTLGVNPPLRLLVKAFTGQKLVMNYEIRSGGTVIKLITWTATNQSIENGKRRKILPSKIRDIKVGDYYYIDGSFFPSDISGAYIPKKNDGCVGIVYALGSTGIANGDNISNYTYSLMQEDKIHGYVVAIDDLKGGNPCEWGSQGTQVGTSTSETDFLGYYNLYKVHTSNGFNVSTWPLFGLTDSHTDPVPTGSSGWYPPSCGQLQTIYSNLTTLDATFVAVGGTKFKSTWYWTSSELRTNAANYGITLDFSDGGYVDSYLKSISEQCYCRPCLTF